MCLWVPVFMGIFACICVGACRTLCVIPLCVCGEGRVDEKGEEKKRLGQSKINAIRYTGKVHWTCKGRQRYLQQRKPSCVNYVFITSLLLIEMCHERRLRQLYFFCCMCGQL